MKKEIAKPKMLIEDECTNWHVGEICLKYNEVERKPIFITEIKDAVNVITNSINSDDIMLQEHMYALYLSRSNQVLGFKTISKGGVSSCNVDPKIILSVGLILNAVQVIICHNHPSGNSDPSKADIDLTRQMIVACNVVGMQLLDHIILTKNIFNSLRNSTTINFEEQHATCR